MDTEEMYRRGQADAEHGEMQPFYYQHYYQYRRGYDGRRRRFRSRAQFISLLVVAIVLVTVGGIGVRAMFRSPGPVMTAAVATPPTTTPQPLFPTPTPIAPTPLIIVADALHVDGFALVQNTSGRTLRARAMPSLTARVQATFREGERVKVLAGPVEADGFRWWRLEGANGNGWSAEQSQDGEIWILPQP